MVALLALLAFLVGSVPFGYLIVRLVFRQDIRKLGSGNIGMTNVWRSFGCVPGFATLVLDLGKGYLPVLGMRLLVKSEAVHPWGSIELTLSAIGLAAIFGHAFRLGWHSAVAKEWRQDWACLLRLLVLGCSYR